MNTARLIKVFIASVMLSSILLFMGAPDWIVYLCCFGLGITWEE